MRIFLHSTHASQEYDLVKMWVRDGHKVTGVFDCYSRQRPKILGITDPDSIPGREKGIIQDELVETQQWSDVVERDRNLATTSKDFRDIDWYILMETAERWKRASHYARMGLHVAIQCFGQESDDEDARLVPVLKEYPNLHLVCYSPQIVDRYIAKGISHKQLHTIRFGIYPEEWQPWIGDLQIALCAHNSIQLRGEGCGWIYYKGISELLPFVLLGKDTEKVGGFGEQHYRALQWWYKRALCYVSMGTKPAPYTMTPIEAMMSGCPLIFWDNGHGIREEEWASSFLVSSDIQEVRNQVAMILDGKIDARILSETSTATALKYFDAHKIAKQWTKFFKENYCEPYKVL